MHTLLFQSVLQCQRVDHGGQHAHVISGDAVHVTRLFRHTTEEISSADDQSDFHAEIVYVLDLRGDGVNAAGFDPKAFVPGQRFTGELEKNAFEGKHAGLSIEQSALFPVVPNARNGRGNPIRRYPLRVSLVYDTEKL